MNGKFTLREIRDTLFISRKTVQGYEKHNLVRSCGKDHYGHLIYDEDVMKRIIKIRFYQELGFTLKEIEILIDGDEKQIKDAIVNKKTEISKKIYLLKNKQKIIESMIKTDSLPDIDYMLKIVKQNNEGGVL